MRGGGWDVGWGRGGLDEGNRSEEEGEEDNHGSCVSVCEGAFWWGEGGERRERGSWHTG